ncbi:MAG: trypsin-like peptidase domain-containing protein [Phycisphaeraceae bacterium]|nr:MAG: trypsin-like peptidase domain-containing protein [Phycisphaeraceae bacterium]
MACVAAAGMALAGVSLGNDFVKPTAETFDSIPIAKLPAFNVGAIDVQAAALLGDAEEQAGMPARFALEQPTRLTPDNSGAWEQVDQDTVMWRLRVTCPNAVSMNFGFTRYMMPEGGRLYIYQTDGQSGIRPFTAADNDAHGELWTPIVAGHDAIIEVTVPFNRQNDLQLELTSINTAYRGFGLDEHAPRSGSCNVDVVCPEGDDWRAEIPSSGVYTLGGTWYCSGSLINNTAEDQTPYFLTAYHCSVTSSSASSVVVYWNFENTTCRVPGSGASGGPGDGSLSQFSSGVIFRAARSTSDFTLTEIEDPLDPAWELAFSGFDATGADASSAVAIHHPNCDEKRISFEYDPTSTTSYLGTSSPGDGTHVRIFDWDLGTTEPGSSGSPLYNQDHRIIGQLHGGYASCTSQTSDYYGKFSVSWDGGTTSTTRLRDWLDPTNTGLLVMDTLWPAQTGMSIRGTGLAAEGPRGGPFVPDSAIYTVKNNLDTPLSYSVSTAAGWLTITGADGSVPAGGEDQITVSLNSGANSFPNGHYEAVVSFVNMTDHDGDSDKIVSVDVGVPAPIYSYDLATNPGWSTEGQWAYGQPTGGNGDHGNPDPTSGHTGANVYGYNLSGAYTNNMGEYDLTTTAIDCSQLTNVSLRFWRWLNVEQPAYDHATIRVSNNGTTWTDVWTNDATITDSSWQQFEYDISDVADNQATVYVKWVMGSTDSSWLFSGWNIDDVEILGVAPDTCLADLNGDGILDLVDVQMFIAAFLAHDAPADLAEPFGVWDLADIQAFIDSFIAGCP